MSSIGRAAPITQPAETVLSSPWFMGDASLAGTGGNLMGLRPLPLRPRLRRSSLEGKASDAQQAARKSVSFSLRTRGPGPAYNSPSPEQLQSPAPRCREQQRTPTTQAAPAGPASVDVVRRLFRAVQGHASSPEPQPNTYQGWVPQPQKSRPSAPPPAPGISEQQAAAGEDQRFPGEDAHRGGEHMAGPAAANEDPGPRVLALDAQALARVRLAISCASATERRAAGSSPRRPHPGSAAPVGGNGWLQQPASLAAQSPGLPTMPQWPHFSGELTRINPQAASSTQQPYQGSAAAAAPGVDPIDLPARSQGASGRVPPSSFAPTAAAAGPDWATARVRAVGNSAVSPRGRTVRGPSGLPKDLTEKVMGDAATGSTHINPSVSFSSPWKTPGSAPRMAKTGTSSPAQRATPTRRTTAASSSRTAKDESPGGGDEQPYATFEQVHLMLASLNLPGTRTFGQLDDAKVDMGQADRSAAPTLSGHCAADQEATGLDPAGEKLSADGLRPPRREAWPSVDGAGARCDSLSTPRRSVSWDAGTVRDIKMSASASSTPVTAAAVHDDAALNAARWRFEQTLAARSPGGPVGRDGAAGGGGSEEWFLLALRPACHAWLQAVAGLVAQQRRAGGEELSDLAQQLREALLERRHVEAYLLGTKLGVPKGRLARLHELAAASGATPSVAAALLSQIEARLRLKVALGVLRRNAAVRVRTYDLLRSREEPGGPLAAAAWQCWKRAAAARLALRSRADAMAAAGQRLLTARVLLTWHATVERTAQLRQLGAKLTALVARSRAAQCLRAWRAAGERCAALRRAEQVCRAARTRRLLAEWRSTTHRVANSGRLRRAAEEHYRFRLLLASLAHWRFFYVSDAVSRAWESALARRRALQLMARAMRVWHFYARRCRQLIRQLAGQRPGAATGAMPLVDETALPAPLALSAVPTRIQRCLASARGFMLAMSDELLHLRSLLRFSLPPTLRSTPAGGASGVSTIMQTPGARAPSGADPDTCLHAAEPAVATCANGAAAHDGNTQLRGLKEAGGLAAALPAADVAGVGQARGGGPVGKQRASPRLLISGQWRHKRQVLVLLAQLRQVERLAADVEAQLEAAERDGRMVRLEFQQRADDIQRRTAASREEMAAAVSQQQAVQADLEQLDKETRALGGYLDRCRAAAMAASEQLHDLEDQVRAAEAQHQQALAAALAAQSREAGLKHEFLAKQAAADEAARAWPHPSFARAQEAERQGRERLLASQRRLSEALQLKAALMAHWRESQVAAASAPRYAAQRHALRVAEAQQQVVEAAKVVSLAELEVQDLLKAVDRLAEATQDARGADDEVQAAAAAAAALAAQAAAAATAAVRDAQEAAAAEQAAQEVVLALRVQLQRLREAQEAEMPQTPSAQQAVLLEPLRAREQAAKVQMEQSRERAEAARRELQAALADAAELSQQVEAAEVAYRAQLLRLQPARAKLQQSGVQLRSRLEAYPSELVRQLRRLVDEHAIEACQDADGNWTVQNLPHEWAHSLRAGLLLSEADWASDEEAGGRGGGSRSRTGLADGPPRAPPGRQPGSPSPVARVNSFSGWVVLSDGASSTPPRAPSDDIPHAAAAADGPAGRSTGAAPPASSGGPVAVPTIPSQPPGLSVSPQSHDPTTAPPARTSQRLQEQEQDPHLQTQQQPQYLGVDLDLHSMTAAQLSRVARSVLGSATLRSVEARLDESPTRSARRGDGFMAAAAVTADAEARAKRSSPGRRHGVQRLASRTRTPPRGASPSARCPASDGLSERQEDAARSPNPWPPRFNTTSAAAGAALGGWAGGPQAATAGTQDLAVLAAHPRLHTHTQTERRTEVQLPAADTARHTSLVVGPPHSGWEAPGLPAGRPTESAAQAPQPPQHSQPLLPLQSAQQQQEQQQQQAGASDIRGGSSSPAHAVPAAAAVSSETRRSISLLEREMGGAGGHVGGVGSTAPAGDEALRTHHESPEGAAAAAAAPLDSLQRGLPSSRLGLQDSHGEDLPMAAEQLPPSAPLPPLPHITPTVRVAGRSSEPRLGHVEMPGGRDVTGRGDVSVELPLPPRDTTVGATPSEEPVGGAEGRFSSASSIYGHFSDPRHLTMVYDAAESGAGAADPLYAPAAIRVGKNALQLPTDPHSDLEQELLLGLSGRLASGGDSDARLPRISDVAATVRRPDHLNCEAPTAAAGQLQGGPAAPGDLAGCGTVPQRRLDDSADGFHRRRLCYRTLQGFRRYAALLACLATSISQVASAARLRWALSDWRQATRAPYQLAQRAASASVCLRALRRWRSYVCERRRRAATLELGLHRSNRRKTAACLATWRLWCERQANKRRAVASAWRHYLGYLMLRWRQAARWSVEGKGRCAAARSLYSRGLCRRCLEHWMRLSRARRLLRRVFTRAEQLWDECTEPSSHFGGEFDALRRAFSHLYRYRVYRLDKRRERINEEAAVAFRTSLLRVRVFAVWQAAVASAWQKRYTRRLVARLVRSWRVLVHGQRDRRSSLCNVRQRLRERGYAQGEVDVRRRWLLRCALIGLGFSRAESCRHYARSLLSRALSSWRQLQTESAALVRAREDRWRRTVFRYWRGQAARAAYLRQACAVLLAQHSRRLLRKGIAAWAAFLELARERARLYSTAALHHGRMLGVRVLRGLAALSRADCARAVTHDVRRRLRRCMGLWRAQAMATRATTIALQQTLMAVGAQVLPATHEPAAQIAATILGGALLDQPHRPFRHRADCESTAAPTKPTAYGDYEQLQPVTSSSPSPRDDNSSDYACHMKVLQGTDGRVAEVLVFEPFAQCARPVRTAQFAAAAAAETQTRSQLSGDCLELSAWNLTMDVGRHESTSSHPFLAESSASAPSQVNLQDLPSDVSSMDAVTLEMWRRYAQHQLADEWRRRQLLQRSMSGWRRCTAKSAYVKSWKLRKGSSRNQQGQR